MSESLRSSSSRSRSNKGLRLQRELMALASVMAMSLASPSCSRVPTDHPMTLCGIALTSDVDHSASPSRRTVRSPRAAASVAV